MQMRPSASARMVRGAAPPLSLLLLLLLLLGLLFLAGGRGRRRDAALLDAVPLCLGISGAPHGDRDLDVVLEAGDLDYVAARVTHLDAQNLVGVRGVEGR